ncbi:MAG: hypothetical protein ACOYON_07265 [Fimbriimonas sp.]
MRKTQIFAAPLVASALVSLVVGCGGGGASGGGGGGGGGTVTGLKVEAVLDSAQSVVVDQTSIQVGDRIKWVLSGRDSNGVRVVVPSQDWGLSPVSAGTLNSSTGVFVGSISLVSPAIINALTATSESYGTSFYLIPTKSVGSGLQLRGTLDGTSTVVDLGNIQVGDKVRLSITGKDGDGNVVTLPTGAWTTDAPSGVGNISNSNRFNAVGSSGTSTYRVQTNAAGRDHFTNLQVKPVQALVFGRTRTTTGAVIPNVIVNFFNSAGVKVGTTRSSSDGTFRASLPTTAVTFHIDLSEADPYSVAYYRQYGFGAKDYAISIPGCRAPLPALTVGVSTNLANDIVVYRITSGSLPPPPPDGC